MAAKVRISVDQEKLFKTSKKPKGAPRAQRIKKKRNELPENQVVSQCVDWMVKVKGWLAFRIHSGLYRRPGSAPFYFGEKGSTDWRFERPLHIRGRVINSSKSAPLMQVLYAEFKQLGKKPDPHQKEWMRKRRILGIPAEWFDSLEKLQEYYKNMGFDAWL